MTYRYVLRIEAQPSPRDLRPWPEVATCEAVLERLGVEAPPVGQDVTVEWTGDQVAAFHQTRRQAGACPRVTWRALP